MNKKFGNSWLKASELCSNMCSELHQIKHYHSDLYYVSKMPCAYFGYLSSMHKYHDYYRKIPFSN